MTESEMTANSLSSHDKRKPNQFWKWFWLSFLVISLAYAWYSFYAPSNDVHWQDDMSTAQELSKGSNKYMLLFFTGKWCSPCQIMKREVFADKKVSSTINSKVIPVMIDIDDSKMKNIVELYKVGSTPLTIFADYNGEVLDYAVGKISKVQFLKMLDNLDKMAVK